MLYLDHAAGSPLLPQVAELHVGMCRQYVANPHGTSLFSEKIRRKVRWAGRRLLELLEIPEDEAKVVWTSGGTESVNLACLGGLGIPGNTGIPLVDPAAHASMLGACSAYAERSEARRVQFDMSAEGALDFGAGCAKIMGEGPDFVAVCHVNNETGAIVDLVGLRDCLRKNIPDARLVVDAVQSFGKCPIPWRAAEIDFLAVSGRKIGGPASVGALICRKSRPLGPLMFGGGQQAGIRPGTVDVVGVLEFIEATEYVFSRRAEICPRVENARRHLRHELKRGWGERVQIVSPGSASPFIMCISFLGYEGAVLMRMLAERGVVVGTGSACSAESSETSHVLRAMGISEEVARGALRVSFGFVNESDDVDRLLHALDEVINDY